MLSRHRRSTPATLLSLVLATSIASSPGARAQDQDQEDIGQHGIFVDTVEVSLINLEVFASHAGEPVTDLAAVDFEVLDDGDPVEITHFSRVNRTPQPAAAEATVDPAPQPTREAPEAPGVATRDQTTVVLLVDQLFVSPISRTRIFEAAAQQLQELIDDGARVMVVNKTRQVSVEQEPTSNPALVRSALDRLAGAATPSYGSEISTMIEVWQITPSAVESRQTGPGQPGPALQTSELDAQRAYQDARALSLRIHQDVLASLDTLRRFLDSLAGLPGRKALVYVADRLPTRPGELLWRTWWEKYGQEHGMNFGVTLTGPSDLELSRPLEELISDANTSRVAFYPVGTDAGPNLSSASSRGLTGQTRTAARTTESQSGDGLRWLAQRSGGRPPSTIGQLDGLFDGVIEDLSASYSLGYASPHSGDGEVHHVEVRVSRPGVALRYPTEYRDKSIQQRMSDRALSALTLGVESNALGVRIAVGKPKRQGKLFEVPVEIHVPMANVVLFPDGASHRGKLSIQWIARDEDGRYSDPVLVRLPFEVANGNVARALSQTIDYTAALTLRDGRHTLALSVSDDLGFSGSTLRVEVDVGSAR
jgi:VWFA-related protein